MTVPFKKRFSLLLGGFLIAIIPLMVFDQALALSALGGVVQDLAGQGLQGAAVTIMNENGGLAGRLKTDQTGAFTLPDVPDGDYFITEVTKGGYDWISPPLIVNPGMPVSLYVLPRSPSLIDAIMVMQVLARTAPQDGMSPLAADFDDNGRIGIGDAIYILQALSDLR